MERRLVYAGRMMEAIMDGSLCISDTWFTDEAHFTLSGHVNKQNHRFWAEENPRIFETTRMKPKRISVWCAIGAKGIFGPIFFDHNVTGASYRKMLLEEFIPYAQALDAVDNNWFMQDGALPHRTNDVFDVLDHHFPRRVIALDFPDRRDGGLDWPPYSPDLNPCDYFFWGYLKDRVYQDNPATIEELKAAITREINAIEKTTLENVVEGFNSRLHAVLDMEGAHIEPFLH